MIATADLLATIVAATRRIVEVRQHAQPASALERPGPTRMRSAAFAALRHSDAAARDAECKRRRLLRNTAADPAAHAHRRTAAGAAAISVLTEPTFFDGSLEHLEHVRAAVELPILRKDFVVSEHPAPRSSRIGADAVLLIAGR